MAYKINNTFGTQIVSLADGTLDTATTDLALLEKGMQDLVRNLTKTLLNF